MTSAHDGSRSIGRRLTPADIEKLKQATRNNAPASNFTVAPRNVGRAPMEQLRSHRITPRFARYRPSSPSMPSDIKLYMRDAMLKLAGGLQ
jgi:hypothetical protein